MLVHDGSSLVPHSPCPTGLVYTYFSVYGQSAMTVGLQRDE